MNVNRAGRLPPLVLRILSAGVTFIALVPPVGMKKREAEPFAALGALLKGARKERGLSLQDLADLTGISRRQIALVETGANTSLHYLAELVQRLGVTEVPLGKTWVRLRPADHQRLIAAMHRATEAAGDVATVLKAFRLEEAVDDPTSLVGHFDDATVVSMPRGKHRNPPLDLLDNPPADAPFRPVKLEVEEEIDIPITGYVAAGVNGIDMLNEDQGETRRVLLSEGPVDPAWKAMIARGESMIEVGIYDGDMVYVEPRRGGVAASGEIIIGWLNDGLVIKEWSRRGGVKRLISKNENIPPIVLTPDDTWELQAIVRGHVPARRRSITFPNLSGKKNGKTSR